MSRNIVNTKTKNVIVVITSVSMVSAKKKLSSEKQAAGTLIKANARSRRMINAVWALAPKTPMFMRHSNNRDVDTGAKKAVVNRLVRMNAWKLMCSGSALRTRETVQKVATKLRMGSMSKESSRYPWLPGISPGAAMLLEQAVCAYVQTGVHHAATLRKMNGSKRINSRMMTMGFDTTDEEIFSGSMLVPRRCVILDKSLLPCKRSKPTPSLKKKDDNADEHDEQAANEEEEANEEQALQTNDSEEEEEAEQEADGTAEKTAGPRARGQKTGSSVAEAVECL